MHLYHSKKLLLFVVALFYYLQTNQSVLADDLFEHHKCLSAIKYYEKKYKIPNNLLYSITIIESGKWFKEHNRKQPWPWALNVGGKTYFFKNKAETKSFLAKKLDEGVTNIDVGCGQISIGYHGQNFNRIDQILNPNYNVAYAAYFLSQNYQQTQNWDEAVANYHSRNKSLGSKYLAKVREVWKKLVNSIDFYKKKERRNYKSNTRFRKKREVLRPKTISDRNKENIIVYDSQNIRGSNVKSFHIPKELKERE